MAEYGPLRNRWDEWLASEPVGQGHTWYGEPAAGHIVQVTNPKWGPPKV